MTSTAALDLRELLSFALDMADEADRIALGYYRGELGTTEKADGTLVTLADKAVEARLREMLGQRYPDHAILGEEQGYTEGAAGAGRWILDPIDGTHGFARGLPIWGTLIAYEAGGVVQLGVASGPALGTRWWAGRGVHLCDHHPGSRQCGTRFGVRRLAGSDRQFAATGHQHHGHGVGGLGDSSDPETSGRTDRPAPRSDARRTGRIRVRSTAA